MKFIPKKNCLNCAFLVRSWEEIDPGIFSFSTTDRMESLASKYRSSILESDLSFLENSSENSLRGHQVWKEEYEQKEREHDLEKRKNRLNLIRVRDNKTIEEKSKELGLPAPPKVYEHDHLKCYHGYWTENSDRENAVVKDYLLKKHCSNSYFPYKKMERKTLKACEKMRSDKEAKGRFLTTAPFIISSALLGLLIFIISYYSLQSQ